jgi:RNA polymerase sigma-70 factor, ECF subfamily
VTPRTVDPARTARFEGVFGRVYEPLQRYLRRRADPTTAEEVLADTLATIWRRLDDVPSDLELAWCYSVARHTLANSRRSRDRQLRLVDKIADRSRTETHTATAADHGIETDDPELDVALSTLSADDRELLRLWAWEQLEVREIATVLDATPNAVSIRLHRAKGRLREALGTESSTPDPDTDGAGPGGQNR